MAAYQRNANSDSITRLSDGVLIPADPRNLDYARFLADVGLDPACVEDPDPPPPPGVPDSVSDRQFFQALAIAGAITQAEALAAVKTGDIPVAMQTVIDGLDSAAKFSAEMLLSGATIFSRSHPMTEALRAAMAWTAEQTDDLWRLAASL